MKKVDIIVIYILYFVVTYPFLFFYQMPLSNVPVKRILLYQCLANQSIFQAERQSLNNDKKLDNLIKNTDTTIHQWKQFIKKNTDYVMHKIPDIIEKLYSNIDDRPHLIPIFTLLITNIKLTEEINKQIFEYLEHSLSRNEHFIYILNIFLKETKYIAPHAFSENSLILSLLDQDLLVLSTKYLSNLFNIIEQLLKSGSFFDRQGDSNKQFQLLNNLYTTLKSKQPAPKHKGKGIRRKIDRSLIKNFLVLKNEANDLLTIDLLQNYFHKIDNYRNINQETKNMIKDHFLNYRKTVLDIILLEYSRKKRLKKLENDSDSTIENKKDIINFSKVSIAYFNAALKKTLKNCMEDYKEDMIATQDNKENYLERINKKNLRIFENMLNTHQKVSFAEKNPSIYANRFTEKFA